MRPEYIFMNVVAPSFILVPLITALIRYQYLSAAGRVLFVYLVVDAVVSILSSTLAYHHVPNMPLYHFATIVDTVLLLYFFLMVFAEKRWARYLIVCMFVFPLLAVLNLLFLQPLFSFNSYMLSLKSMLLIGLCFLYWWYYEPVAGKAWKTIPLHWIISGLLLYFSSVFILFTFSDLIISISSRSISIVLWNIHAGLSVIMYLLLAIGLSKYKS
ncbi:MAG TPA: hypothetical protein VF487_10410 [Chitinophagaceae bacterium]